MALKEMLRGSVLIGDVASLFGIDLRNDEPQEGDRPELRERDMHSLRLAQLFVGFNPNRGYALGTRAPKSRLYSPEEIAKVLTNNGHSPNLEQGKTRAQEIIDKGYIGFYWASRGAAGVKVVPYENEGCSSGSCAVETTSSQGTMYRFEVDFCDDGL